MRWITGIIGLVGGLFGGIGPFRPGSNAAGCWAFVCGLFVVIVVVAWLFGFSPAETSGWFDAHADLWRWIGGWLWRGFWIVALLFCAAILFAIGLEWFGKKAEGFEDAPRDVKGGCCALVAIAVVGYFAWVAITMPLD